MSSSDGSVHGIATVADHGDPALRWNLVILGDGYQASELPKYASDVDAFVRTFERTPPFDELFPGINVFRIDVASAESGAADPTACGGTGVHPRTFFDASFCTNGNRRLLVVNASTVHAVVNEQMPQAHMIMVMVNSTVYGGSGGGVATFSLAPEAQEIALHEMGHTAFGFADEYESYAGCGVDAPGTHDAYSGREPTQPNITANANAASIKWRALVTPGTAIPTTSNANCAECDPQPNPLPATTVGAYEGAGYFHCRLYRAQFNCRMRTLGNDYCAVCRNVIRSVIARHVPPAKPAVPVAARPARKTPARRR